MTGIGVRLLALAAVLISAPVEASTHPVNVLILLPGQPGLPAPTLIASGVRSRLFTAWPLRVSFDTEYVDVRSFASPAEAERRLQTLFESTHKGRRYDVIIAVSHEPLGFAIRTRDVLWPGTPVVVCAIDERTVGGLVVPSGTVVTTRYDAEGTLRAALQILPDTKHVVLIGGAGIPDRPFRDLFYQTLRRDVDVIDLTPLPFADVLARVRALPEKSFVFISAFQSDAGRNVYGLEMMEPLADAANRPMFNMFNHVLGRGIVGGSMTDFETLGREAGDVAARVLRGESLPSFVPSRIPSVLRFDGRQLTRWGIDERRLPAGSEVLYPRVTVWSQYRWHIIAMISVIGMQAGLIAKLLVQRRRRLEMERQLAEGLRFEGLVREIGAALTVVPADRLEGQIRTCLEQISKRLGAHVGGVWRPIVASRALELFHDWRADDVPPLPVFLDLRRFPYLASLMSPPSGVVSLDRVDDLARVAAEDHAALEELGVHALAAIPLYAEDRPLGVLAFANMRGQYAWPEGFLRQFGSLAECFTNALLRAESAAALQSSAALTESVLAVLPGEAAIVDASGRIIRTNEAWTSVATATRDEADAPADIADQPVADAAPRIDALRAIGMPAGVAALVDEAIVSIIRGERDEFTLGYAGARRGQERWFELRVRRVGRLQGGAAVMNFDVTARRHAEAAMQRHLADIAHVDRIAAVAHLASSIAHELSGPMTAILTNAQAAERLLTRPDVDQNDIRACLSDIVEDDRRATAILGRIRNMIKKTTVATAPVALNDLVTVTIGLVTNEALLHGVSIEFTPAPALPIVRGDAIQLQQVILNLLMNAIAAAAAGREARKVTVRTSTDASAIELSVHDTGPGIAPADMEHLFEPFFTTKPEGLGMGLAITRTIVEAHGGRLEVRNDTTDGGATFRMLLPTEGAGGP